MADMGSSGKADGGAKLPSSPNAKKPEPKKEEKPPTAESKPKGEEPKDKDLSKGSESKPQAKRPSLPSIPKEIHPSIAGHQGSGSTFLLAFIIIVMWLQITKRIPNIRKVYSSPAPAAPDATPASGSSVPPGTLPPSSSTKPYLPKWDKTWGPIPSDWPVKS